MYKDQTIVLAHTCQLGIQIGDRSFEHLAMARVLNRLELLQNVTAGEVQRFFPLLHGRLLRYKSLLQLALRVCCGLLLLH